MATDAPRATLRRSHAVFLVSDIAATIPWYVTNLGFTADPFPPSPPHTFCILRRDEVTIMLQQLNGYAKPDLYGDRAGGVWNVYIETAGITALYQALSRRSEVTIVGGLRRQPYGQIELEVRDPNGYLLVFAEPAR